MIDLKDYNISDVEYREKNILGNHIEGVPQSNTARIVKLVMRDLKHYNIYQI